MASNTPFPYKKRIALILGGFVLLFSAVAARSFYLQVIQHDQLVKLAEKQHSKTISVVPARGGIFDRTGAPLAVSLDMDSLFAEPRRVTNPAAAAAALAPILHMDQQELVRKLSVDKGFIWIARQLTPEATKQIKQLKLFGLGFAKESKRFYPNFEMAAHVLGFTGLDPGGLEGVEKQYNTVIQGENGFLLTERDALGRDVTIKQAVVHNAVPGKNITLTLDKNIQYFTEKELAKAVTQSQAKGGIAIVADPYTGKILALANYPSFNPNSFKSYPLTALRNRSVADSFEPGSTFKMFLMSAAIEEKVVRPQDTIHCENGRYSFGGRLIRDDHPHGRVTVAEVLKYSSNIGSAKIGFKLGEDRLHRYLKSFGFGEKSNIDLPGEAVGSLRPPNKWYSIDLATISFGQGVSTTAIQLTSAVSAIANGGVLMKPYLVERITDNAGHEVQKFEPRVIRRVISPETAKTVTQMMEGVVQTGGTATKAAIDGIRVAGKTGTAQKIDPATRTYSPSKRTATFIGFVPADRPVLTIAVIIDEPKTSPYGGVVAAPAFKEIAFNSLCYLKVAGVGRTPEASSKSVPPPKASGTRQPASPTAVENSRVEAAAAGTTMPDFRGMSMRQVLKVMEKRQLNIQLRGSGRVVGQHPQPGSAIRPSDSVWVKLESGL